MRHHPRQKVRARAVSNSDEETVFSTILLISFFRGTSRFSSVLDVAKRLGHNEIYRLLVESWQSGVDKKAAGFLHHDSRPSDALPRSCLPVASVSEISSITGMVVFALLHKSSEMQT